MFVRVGRLVVGIMIVMLFILPLFTFSLFFGEEVVVGVMVSFGDTVQLFFG